jgi:hypothetical protein
MHVHRIAVSRVGIGSQRMLTERARWRQWFTFSESPITPASGTPRSALEIARRWSMRTRTGRLDEADRIAVVDTRRHDECVALQEPPELLRLLSHESECSARRHAGGMCVEENLIGAAMCARMSDSASWPSRTFNARNICHAPGRPARAAPAWRRIACDRCAAGVQVAAQRLRDALVAARTRDAFVEVEHLLLPRTLAARNRGARAYASSSCAIRSSSSLEMRCAARLHAMPQRHAHLEEWRTKSSVSSTTRARWYGSRDELVALQPADRLAHRSAARAVFVGESRLVQERARRKAAS